MEALSPAQFDRICRRLTVDRLTSKKLVLNLAGIAGILGIAAMTAQLGLLDPERYILAILTVAGVGTVVQAGLDAKNGRGS